MMKMVHKKEIAKGMSGDKKYFCISEENERYLLRLSDMDMYEVKKKEYEYLSMLGRSGLPVPECIDFGIDEKENKVYTLLSWIEGDEAEKILPTLTDSEQYSFGVLAGKILKEIHNASQTNIGEKCWYDRYFEVIAPRLDAYQHDGIAFNGSDNILKYIEDNKYLLRDRTQCYHHGDYHIGNMIIKDNGLYIIDWHTVDFDNTGDPWYEFNRIGAEYPFFASGQIDGYFNGNVPNEFWRVFALYFSAGAITSIVWAKYCAPKQMDYVMKLNANIVTWFDNMNNPIPSWYCGDK